VQKGVLVLSAAGNCVGFVVAPAVYPEVIAVAAVNERSEPWKGTSRGSAVAISAPGADVWHAVRKPNDDGKTKVVLPGDGTSYAVAMTAGAAALWLDAYRTSRTLTASPPNPQEVLRADLRASARVPAGWDGQKMGAGILDAGRLLQRAAAPQAHVAAPSPVAAKPTPLQLLARLVDADPGVVQRNVAELLGKPVESIPPFLETYGQELMAIVMADPQGLVPVLAKPTVESTPRLRAMRTPVLAQASQALREAVSR